MAGLIKQTSMPKRTTEVTCGRSRKSVLTSGTIMEKRAFSIVATCRSASVDRSISGVVDPRAAGKMRGTGRGVGVAITFGVLLGHDDGYTKDLVAISDSRRGLGMHTFATLSILLQVRTTASKPCMAEPREGVGTRLRDVVGAH